MVEEVEGEKLNILERTVNLLTVSDFKDLLTKKHRKYGYVYEGANVQKKRAVIPTTLNI